MFLSLIFGYFLSHQIHPIVIFGCSLLSTIPLSYYNGMAIASLSAQTSFAIGALINASFGSIIELILYVVSIKAQMEDVARAALTGALLGALLLIPGLSMIIGGIKYKEQKFNPAATGVSRYYSIFNIIIECHCLCWIQCVVGDQCCRSFLSHSLLSSLWKSLMDV